MLCWSHRRILTAHTKGKGASCVAWKRLFRTLMCSFCALIFVLNSRGPQRAAAESPAAAPPSPAPSAERFSAAWRRLAESRPDLDISSWEYALYSYGHPVRQEPAETVRVDGTPVDARIAPALRDMIEGARAQGLNVYLASGYTDAAAQNHIYRRAVDRYGEFGAQSVVGRPGESEHRSGLCIDIMDGYYEEKDESLASTELFIWLKMHCSEYGFVLRYPEGKKAITGYVFEPWHFRYVGVEAAEFMTDNGLTLEEFRALYPLAEG